MFLRYLIQSEPDWQLPCSLNHSFGGVQIEPWSGWVHPPCQALCDDENDCKVNPLYSSSPFLHWPTFACKCLWYIYFIFCRLLFRIWVFLPHDPSPEAMAPQSTLAVFTHCQSSAATLCCNTCLLLVQKQMGKPSHCKDSTGNKHCNHRILRIKCIRLIITPPLFEGPGNNLCAQKWPLNILVDFQSETTVGNLRSSAILS